MKPILMSLFIFLNFITAHAQTKINLEDIKQHIGDSVTVCGKVADLRYFESSKNQPTFLNIGAKYPNHQLTLVIWGEARKLFTGKVEDLLNTNICITGRLILYKEKPEIIIEKPEQIIIQ